MRWDDRDDDDPFSEIFREIERMMDEVAGVDANVNTHALDDGGSEGTAHFSVYEDEDIRVVGDLPGVSKEDIDIRCDGRYLTVDAATDAREYRERIKLPARVDEHSAQASFNNGVLEITLERADGSANIDLS